jgi:hypothetical protein
MNAGWVNRAGGRSFSHLEFKFDYILIEICDKVQQAQPVN